MKTCKMWAFTWESYGGRRLEAATTKREAIKLRGELSHHPVGDLIKIELPAPKAPRG